MIGGAASGENGYVAQIGNDIFAWFCSTESKSRIDFLQLLQAGERRYCITMEALDLRASRGCPRRRCSAWSAIRRRNSRRQRPGRNTSITLGIATERHRRIATEGGLLGGLLEQGLSTDLAIVSDGAGQFSILRHALCWVHAERLVHKLIPLNDQHRQDLARVRGEISISMRPQGLPTPAESRGGYGSGGALRRLVTQRTAFATLNQTLKRLHAHKSALLLVLQRPDIPLHTNGSENDIRGYVKWRKISGGTRSDLGRRCRDSFASLKKTCRNSGSRSGTT